ncbi:MAG: hypothetical protein AAGB19_08660 [Cyanobacteria bacterium P01_F01_bin.3]
MPTVTQAIAELQLARMRLDAACDIVTKAENKHGVDSKEAEAEVNGLQSEAGDDVIAAEKALAAIPAQTAHDAMQKAMALLNEVVEPATVKAIRSDLAKFVDLKPDPVVPLCQRILCIRETLNNLPNDQVEAPQMLEAFNQAVTLERKLAQTAPTTPLGVALMASVMWQIDGPSSQVGSEQWLEDLQRPEHALLARLRQGAFNVAGKEAYEALGLRP